MTFHKKVTNRIKKDTSIRDGSFRFCGHFLYLIICLPVLDGNKFGLQKLLSLDLKPIKTVNECKLILELYKL